MRLFTVNAGMAAFVQGAPFILEPADPRGKGVKEFLHRLATIFVGKIAIASTSAATRRNKALRFDRMRRWSIARQWASIHASTLQLALSVDSPLNR